MRRQLIPLAGLALALALALGAPPASAEDVSVVGPVIRIVLAADGQSAVGTLKDVRSGEEVKVDIRDEATLDKFKDKRIVEGDEIRARFEKKESGNAAKSFRKTAGC